MSTTTTTLPTVSSAIPTIPPSGSPPIPAPSPAQTGAGGGGPSSSLYLRRIEEAILAGVIVPNQAGRVSRRRAIGEKPKLWEARVSPAGGDRWDSIVPVSALRAPNEPAEKARDHEKPTPSPPSPYSPPALFHRRLLLNPFARRSRSSPPPLVSEPSPFEFENSPSSPKQSASALVHDPLQVTVLITMPDPRRPHLDGTGPHTLSKGKERSLDLDCDEEDLPEMVLGVAELQYKDTAIPQKSA
ncbi:hypothetical protein B0F90DRAFT_1815766 [Multifurca ochricompacta]|uniref:Uncharacterized protein n=1 Tax=Multifurca ochricompacta TaxID=376703 RepID=A0AAD4M7E1_9AGAM|nr:hypothetical protein B0F90DRAFT_1815766 [Multifurca ochricompacta]